ncbi:unnamed protein product [Rhizoctonia solani]|uniref:glucan 1,3-beta-glucosidase n=1 Tax=Rhizoctonia solani TaxID=456999 RepID=A0A8H3E1K2_9AGAM|nr:unnamed protein product [Rhizoctonia solani]
MSSGGAARVLEEHYKTFITGEDFAQIAVAGLNWIPIPVPYWAVKKFENRPFLEGVAWKRLNERKCGPCINNTINVDLHTIPGSHVRFKHSGERGQVDCGTMDDYGFAAAGEWNVALNDCGRRWIDCDERRRVDVCVQQQVWWILGAPSYQPIQQLGTSSELVTSSQPTVEVRRGPDSGPFISPALYEPYQPSAIDEWTLCEAIEADKSSGGVAKVIEERFETFITEEDFAKIAAAGLNWVRIPIPYWAVKKFDNELFLEGVALNLVDQDHADASDLYDLRHTRHDARSHLYQCTRLGRDWLDYSPDRRWKWLDWGGSAVNAKLSSYVLAATDINQDLCTFCVLGVGLCI